MNLKKITFLVIILIGVVVCYAKQDFVYDSKGRRDPFLPVVSKDGYIINREADVPVSDMNLEGIIYDEGGKSLAIINGNVLKVGDKIGIYAISMIEKKKVILQSNSEEFILNLKQEE